MDEKKWIQAGFAWVILAVWVASFVASLCIPGYRIPLEIHAALAIVSGWLFGQGIVKKLVHRNGGNGAKLDK